MENTARVFNCAQCHRQVMICRRCDRGNIYCGTPCSQSARRHSQHAAAQRYQRTRRGRLLHAERQRRYRSHRRKVTHQGSPPSSLHASLSPESKVTGAYSGSVPVVRAQGLHCHFCKRLCSSFVRLDFLHSPGPRLIRPPWVRP